MEYRSIPPIRQSKMHRFFLPPESIGVDQVHLPAETAHQLVRVLRFQPGQSVIVLDNRGIEYVVELVDLSLPFAYGRVIERREASGEPQVKVSLFLGLTQREKFEWVLQKGTEIGVTSFIPVITRRSLVQDLDGLRPGSVKLRRWRRILQEAAEQSERGRIPELHIPLQLPDLLAEGSQTTELPIILWEGKNAPDLKRVLRETQQQSNKTLHQIRLLVGPEGGFSPEELDLASNSGWLPASLGPRILRMETAAIVASALVLYELGEMKISLK
jgi:16S rRNA (uracil1498-N3)-methyltransferase